MIGHGIKEDGVDMMADSCCTFGKTGVLLKLERGAGVIIRAQHALAKKAK